MRLNKSMYGVLIFTALLLSCNGQGQKDENKKTNTETGEVTLPVEDTTGTLMNEDEFWKIIEKSGVEANNDYQRQINSLKTILLTLDASSIQAFNNRFISFMAATYDFKLWGAAYTINGGCSDDCFEYFRQYLIGHGKDKFYNTIKDPESCVSWIKSEEEDMWEGIQYAAPKAYKQKTGKEIRQPNNIKFELKGKPFDEETVFKDYPKLAKKFMGGN